MSLLSQVTKGKIAQPFLGIVYGVDGVGKSTLAAQMPNVVFMGTERGTYNLDVARLPSPSSFEDVMALIKALTDEPHPYQSLAIDSLDWIEPLIWQKTLDRKSDKKTYNHIEDFGFSKGFLYAVDDWRTMSNALNKLRDTRNMNIMMLAHAQSKDAKDPTVTADYKKYQLKLDDKGAAFLREWVDNVLFANFETLTAADKQGKTRAFGDGARYLFTEERPAYKAKNRFGLPAQIPLDWNELWGMIQSSNPESSEVIRHRIEVMLVEPSTTHVRDKVKESVEMFIDNVDELKRIENKLKTIVNAPSA